MAISYETAAPATTAVAGSGFSNQKDNYAGKETIISITAATTLSADTHSGRLMSFDAAAATTVTLPAATGTGDSYSFTNGIIATGSHIVRVKSTEILTGGVVVSDEAAATTATCFGTVADSDHILMNGTTTGSASVGGDYVTFTDVLTGYWTVRGFLCGTGSEATPFPAAAYS